MELYGQTVEERLEEIMESAFEAFREKLVEELGFDSSGGTSPLVIWNGHGVRIDFGSYGEIDVEAAHRLNLVRMVEDEIISEDDLTDEEKFDLGFIEDF